MAVANRYSVHDSCRPCGSRTHHAVGLPFPPSCTVKTVHVRLKPYMSANSRTRGCGTGVWGCLHPQHCRSMAGSCAQVRLLRGRTGEMWKTALRRSPLLFAGIEPHWTDGKTFCKNRSHRPNHRGWKTLRVYHRDCVGRGHSSPLPCFDPQQLFRVEKRLSTPSAGWSNVAPLRLPMLSCGAHQTPSPPRAHLDPPHLTGGTGGWPAHALLVFRGGKHEKSPLALAPRGFMSVDCFLSLDVNCGCWRTLQF